MKNSKLKNSAKSNKKKMYNRAKQLNAPVKCETWALCVNALTSFFGTVSMTARQYLQILISLAVYLITDTPEERVIKNGVRFIGSLLH